MYLIRLLSLLSCCSLGSCLGEVSAQAPAPTQVCILNDTISWTNPVQQGDCRVGQVAVFAAADRGGTYDFLGVRDRTQSSEFALTPAQASAYSHFYTQGQFNGVSCRPQGRSSDTISREPLPKIDIRSVDHDRGGTTVSWDEPDDPRVSSYIVYRVVDERPFPVDTLFGETTYLDGLTQVEGTSNTYYITSANDCGSTSFNEDAYSSVTVTAQRDACEGVLTLTSSMRADWPRDFTEAIVYRTRRLGGYTDSLFVDSVGVGDTFRIPDLEPDTAYSVRVSYVDVAGARTTSFPQDLQSEVVVREDVLEIVQLTYDQQQEDWSMRWRWDTRADYREIVWRIRAGETVLREGGVDSTANKLQAPVVPLGLGPDFDWTGATLTISATDACEVTRESEPVAPVVIESEELDPVSVGLEWRYPQVRRYSRTLGTELRVLDSVGSVPILQTSDTEVRGFVHDASAILTRQVCYELGVDIEAPPTLDRAQEVYSWRSAPTCVLRDPRVYLPTGFKPDGYTTEYKPKMSLLDDLRGSYALRVFDRWGQLAFETDRVEEGWDGRVNGSPLPGGAYVAHVELTDATMRVYRFEVVFILVR